MLNLTIFWMNPVGLPIKRLTRDDQWGFLLKVPCLSLFINEPGSFMTTILHSSHYCALFVWTFYGHWTAVNVDPPCMQFTKASEGWKLSSRRNTINPNCLLNKLSKQLCLCAIAGHQSWWDCDNRDWEMKIWRWRVFNLFLGVITAGRDLLVNTQRSTRLENKKYTNMSYWDKRLSYYRKTKIWTHYGKLSAWIKGT